MMTHDPVPVRDREPGGGNVAAERFGLVLAKLRIAEAACDLGLRQGRMRCGEAVWGDRLYRVVAARRLGLLVA